LIIEILHLVLDLVSASHIFKIDLVLWRSIPTH